MDTMTAVMTDEHPLDPLEVELVLCRNRRGHHHIIISSTSAGAGDLLRHTHTHTYTYTHTHTSLDNGTAQARAPTQAASTHSLVHSLTHYEYLHTTVAFMFVQLYGEQAMTHTQCIHMAVP